MTEQKIFTVTEINLLTKEVLENTFSSIWVQGEISNFKTAVSGHMYFDLKDEESTISSVMFKGYGKYLDTKLENGLFVTVSANMSVYTKQGRYQLVVTSIKPHSKGDLYLKFEKLKQKLKDKGYFDEDRKKPLPKYPKRIGVVTSLKGAAIRDILTILKQRYPNLEVIIAHASVQGNNAKYEIADAIANLNAYRPKADALLVGRGGGSIEDLWPFNEEIVARAIFKSKIPVISCVGHETDFTISDFTADFRAPTPSAAVQVIVKNQKEVTETIYLLEKRLLQSLEIIYQKLKTNTEQFLRSYVFKNPDILWQSKSQTCDKIYDDLLASFENKLKTVTEKTNLLTGKLKTLNPTNVLKRGYSVVKFKDKVINSSDSLQKKDIINVELYKGSLIAEVTDKD